MEAVVNLKFDEEPKYEAHVQGFHLNHSEFLFFPSPPLFFLISLRRQW